MKSSEKKSKFIQFTAILADKKDDNLSKYLIYKGIPPGNSLFKKKLAKRGEGLPEATTGLLKRQMEMLCLSCFMFLHAFVYRGRTVHA